MIHIANPDDLGQALADLRLLHRMRRRHVAEAAGLFESQYGGYELGRKVPTLPILLRIFAVYGYDLALVPREEA